MWEVRKHFFSLGMSLNVTYSERLSLIILSSSSCLPILHLSFLFISLRLFMKSCTSCNSCISFVRHHGLFHSAPALISFWCAFLYRRGECHQSTCLRSVCSWVFPSDLIFTNQKFSQEGIIWNSVMWQGTEDSRNNVAQIMAEKTQF